MSALLAIDGKLMLFDALLAGRHLDVIAGKTPEAGAHPMSAPLAIDGKPMLFDVLLPDGIWTSLLAKHLKLERTR